MKIVTREIYSKSDKIKIFTYHSKTQLNTKNNNI